MTTPITSSSMQQPSSTSNMTQTTSSKDLTMPSHSSSAVMQATMSGALSYNMTQTASSSDRSHPSSMMQSTMATELRATTAGAALARAGAILRGGGNQYLNKGKLIDHYEKSFKVFVIRYFWSHSWRASARQKLLTLMLFHNGDGAAVVSLICACLGSFLAWPNRLTKIYYTPVPTFIAGVLCGFVGFALTLLHWKSKTTVFLDKICIHQTDAQLKENGIKSLGGYIRHSQQMLILWDKSYLERLWCTFELATVLKLKDTATAIRVQPVRGGQLVLFGIVAPTGTYMIALLLEGLLFLIPGVPRYIPLLFQLIGAIVATSVLAPYLRTWAREVAAIQQDVATLSFINTKCFCCDNEHVMPQTGEAIPCDRELVKQCIESWFGSTDAFDVFARESFARRFDVGCLSYRETLMIALPRIWICVALVSSFSIEYEGLSYSKAPLTLFWECLCAYCSLPCLLYCIGRLAFLFDRAPLGGCVGWLVNAFVAILSFCLLLIEAFLNQAVLTYAADAMGWMAYPGALVLYSVIHLAFFPDLRAFCRAVLKRAAENLHLFTKRAISEPQLDDSVCQYDASAARNDENDLQHVENQTRRESQQQLPNSQSSTDGVSECNKMNFYV